MNASVYSTSGRVALDEKELSLLDTSRIASTGSHTDLKFAICRDWDYLFLIITGGTIGIYAILE